MHNGTDKEILSEMKCTAQKVLLSYDHADKIQNDQHLQTL